MPEITLLSVLLVGLLGGVHCAGMCGGIVGVLAARPGDRPQLAAGTGRRTIPIRAAAPAISRQLGYNLGRIASYVALGSVAGTLGSGAALFSGVLPLQQAAFVAANALLIAIGLYLTGALGTLAPLERLGVPLWRRVAPAASRLLSARSWGATVAAGALWGLVPCGMVYGVLVAAVVSGDPARGAALMLAFGLGTLPNLLALGWSAGALRGWLSRRPVRVTAGLIVLAFGVAGLARLDPTRHLHRLIDLCLTLF